MNTEEIFEKIIAKWRRRTNPGEGLTLPQIANIALGNGNSRNAGLVGRTLNEFIVYFRPPSRTGYKWEVNWGLVQRDYPNLLDRKPKSTKTLEPAEAIEEMCRALDDEIRPIKSLGAYLVAEQSDGAFLYEAVVELPGDTELPIPEGVRIRLRWPNFVERCVIEATLLSYDAVRSTIIFETDRALSQRHLFTDFVIEPLVDELLKIVKATLSLVAANAQCLALRLLKNDFEPIGRPWPSIVSPEGLDESQLLAVTTCLGQDVTFVWGPPGTGKTHALARLIANAALANEKVVATAIANVAVDQLALRVVDALEQAGPAGRALLNDGHVFRFGHPRLPAVSGESRLFPRRSEIQETRKELHEAQKRHADIPRADAHARALGQKQINDLKERLRALTRAVFDEAKIILTTAVQVCLEPAFADSPFGLMVVDEASMMPIPYLMCMGLFARDRFVVAGDFQQLGPIALSKSELAQRWLHRNGFDLTGISDKLSHPALTMLTTQRRMHESICQLINNIFYQGKLRTAVPPLALTATRLKPLPGTAAVFVLLLKEDGSHVEQTESGSRCNKRSAEESVKAAYSCVKEDEKLSVGIVTPYRAQVSLIKRLRDESLPKEAARRINVGTVHAFQGSESDVIIWDLVETRNHSIGRLYRQATGDRLTNVAISRAKGKLIIIGDRDAFSHAPGGDLVRRLRPLLTMNFSARSPNVISVRDLS